MHAAKGILTSRGGMTSHAAVVARGMGKPCVCGAGELAIDYRRAPAAASARSQVAEGEVITIDGSRGEVILGAVPTVDPKLSGDFATLMGWADERRRLRVRANADTPADARTARRFGAEGIGLCRTEHMFFEDARILAMREMILAGDAEGRRAALAKILPMQRAGLRRAVRDHGRAAGHHPPARPAAARVPAARAGGDRGGRQGGRGRRRGAAAARRRAPGSQPDARACAAAGSASCSPRSTRCRRARSSRRRLPRPQRSGRAVEPEVMVPLISDARELALIKQAIDAVAQEVDRARAASRWTTRSAP